MYVCKLSHISYHIYMHLFIQQMFTSTDTMCMPVNMHRCIHMYVEYYVPAGLPCIT